MPELPGRERREGRRAKRHGRRIVRSGEEFTSDELEQGLIELEKRGPSGPEPEGGGTEPWGTSDPTGEMAERLALYLEFIKGRERNGNQ